MQASFDQAAEDAALGAELGATRLAMAQAFAEIDNPTVLKLAMSRLANASARTVRANMARKREGRESRG